MISYEASLHTYHEEEVKEDTITGTHKVCNRFHKIPRNLRFNGEETQLERIHEGCDESMTDLVYEVEDVAPLSKGTNA